MREDPSNCLTTDCRMPEYQDGLCYDCGRTAFAEKKAREISARLKQPDFEAEKAAEARRNYSEMEAQVNAADQAEERRKERLLRQRPAKIASATLPPTAPSTPKPVEKTVESKPEVSETAAAADAPAECTVTRCLYPPVRLTLCGACLSTLNIWLKDQVADTRRIDPSPEQLSRFRELLEE